MVSSKEKYPVLPLRDIVVYPKMIVPLFVGREKSIKALQEVVDNDKNIILATQKNASVEDPTPDDIYHTGTMGTILQLLKLPDGTVKVLIEGLERVRIDKFLKNDVFSVMLAVKVPLFHWGEGHRKVKSAKIEMQKAEVTRCEMVEKMQLEVARNRPPRFWYQSGK